MAKPATTDRIIEIAEREIRTGGYASVSFREIAAEIGIKSASVHYHFPTKADLGQTVASRYTDRFMSALGAPEESPPAEQLRSYVDQFRKALVEDGKMCLCGLFGAQVDVLPEGVADEVKRFFACNIDWLTQVYAAQMRTNPKDKACQTLSLLEGAMILARTLGDNDLFDRAARVVSE